MPFFVSILLQKIIFRLLFIEIITINLMNMKNENDICNFTIELYFVSFGEIVFFLYICTFKTCLNFY